MWWRARMLGGRTNHYGRISLRMGPYDFKPYSRDGKGFDWPITYEELAPYYDKAEELIGVFGTAEGLENTPDGKFQPAPAPRSQRTAHQAHLRQAEDPVHSIAPRHTDPAAERPAGLSLLRAMRTRLRRECQLQFARSTYCSRHEDRQSRSAHRTPWCAKWWWVRTAWHAASRT